METKGVGGDILDTVDMLVEVDESPLTKGVEQGVG